MEKPQAESERVLVLVKALPHASDGYGETVCCAGVTESGAWRRQYPVRFRMLKDKFQRWHWIEYQWRKPRGDKRPESRRVQEESIQRCGELRSSDRARLLNPIIEPSVAAATAKGKTLTIVRPLRSEFSWRKKTGEQIASERSAYLSAAQQLSFLDVELQAFEPCEYEFRMKFEDDAGNHDHACMDWETTAAFWKLAKIYGADGALSHLDRQFNHEYPKKGLVLALGTHSLRPKQWLLVGVIRLDVVSQAVLPL